MKVETFRISIDPHPKGQLRLIHDGKESEIWDFETIGETITFLRVMRIVEDYCFESSSSRSKVYFDPKALELVKLRILSMKNELKNYERLMNMIVSDSSAKKSSKTKKKGDVSKCPPLMKE